MAALSSRLSARWAIRRILIARGTLREKCCRMKYLVAPESPLDHDVHTVSERIRRNAAIIHVVGVSSIGHAERCLAATRLAYDRAADNTRTDLDTRVVERRVCRDLARKLRRREIVRGRFTDGACHQISGRAKNQRTASQEFGARFHSLEIYRLVQPQMGRPARKPHTLPPLPRSLRQTTVAPRRWRRCRPERTCAARTGSTVIAT